MVASIRLVQRPARRNCTCSHCHIMGVKYGTSAKVSARSGWSQEGPPICVTAEVSARMICSPSVTLSKRGLQSGLDQPTLKRAVAQRHATPTNPPGKDTASAYKLRKVSCSSDWRLSSCKSGVHSVTRPTSNVSSFLISAGMSLKPPPTLSATSWAKASA